MVDIADAGGKSWLRFAEPKALREGGVDHSVRIRLVTQVTTDGGSIGLGSDDLAAVAEKLPLGAGSYRALIFIVTNADSRGPIVDHLVCGIAIARLLLQKANV